MSADPGTLHIISGWLADLSRLVRHGEARPDAEQLALYAAMLGKVLPSGAFTPDSLLHVGSTMTWWPELASLRPALLAWWDAANKPPAVPMIGCDSGPAAALTGMDAHWLAYYQRRLAGLTGEPLTAERRANLDSLIRAQSLPAWRVICGQGAPYEPVTTAQMAAVRQAIAAAVVPQASPSTPPASPRPVSVPVSAERLAAMRAADPLVQRALAQRQALQVEADAKDAAGLRAEEATAAAAAAARAAPPPQHQAAKPAVLPWDAWLEKAR